MKKLNVYGNNTSLKIITVTKLNIMVKFYSLKLNYWDTSCDKNDCM